MNTASSKAHAQNGPVTLHYEISHCDQDSTTGIPLLLVNGLGSPMVSYEDGFVAELNQRGFDVVRFDNRDVGKSTRFEGTEAVYGISDMAADAVAVLDAVGWDEAVVVGQSMGGMIVQQMTIDHPDRVTAMVSVMSSSSEPGFGTPTEEALAGLLTPAPTELEAWLDHRVSTERLWASPDLWDQDWVRTKGRAMFAHGVNPAGTARQYKAIVASGPRTEGLKAIDTPTLVVHGSADTLIQPDGGRRVADLIPGAQYLEIGGMGHDLPPALWTRLGDEIARFAHTVTGQ